MEGEVVVQMADKPAAAPAAEKAASRPPDPPVPYLSMFEFANRLDYILMAVGTIGGIVNGLCLPGLSLFLRSLLSNLRQRFLFCLGTFSIPLEEDLHLKNFIVR